MKKSILIPVLVVFVVACTLLLWKLIALKRKNDEIIQKFTEVNEKMKAATDTVPGKNTSDDIASRATIAFGNTEIVLLIDSLTLRYEKFPDTAISGSKSQLQNDTKRLLKKIQAANKFKWDMMDSAIPDTIKYWSSSHKFSEDIWYKTYFENQPKEISAVYLNFLKNEVIANSQ